MPKKSNPDELKTAALAVRVKPWLKAILESLAKADKRSLASYIEIALEKHVRHEMGTDGGSMSDNYRRSLSVASKSRK